MALIQNWLRHFTTFKKRASSLLVICALSSVQVNASVTVPIVSPLDVLESNLETGVSLLPTITVREIPANLQNYQFSVTSPASDDQFNFNFGSYTFDSNSGEIADSGTVLATATGFGNSALPSLTIAFTDQTNSTAIVETILRGITITNTSATAINSRRIRLQFVDPTSNIINIFAEVNYTSATTSHDLNVAADVGRKVVKFSDIDNDGVMEVLVGRPTGELDYYENTGTATNPTYVQQSGGNDPFNGFDVGDDAYPALIDIDNDNDFDLFIGRQDGTISFYENTGTVSTPTYTEQTGINNPLSSVDVGENASISFGDLDGDIDFDLFIGNDSGDIAYYQNTGTVSAAAFTAQTGVNNPADSINVTSNANVELIDIDNDDDLDLFVGNEAGDLAYFLNTGSDSSAVLTEQSSNNNPFDGEVLGGFVTATFVDFDFDSDFDLFVGNSSLDFIYYENQSQFPLSVTEENDAPVIDVAASINVEENQASVVLVGLSDEEDTSLTVALSGDDSALFDLTNTGVLTFLANPNFEQASDLDTNNDYELTITLTDTQSVSTVANFTVNVTNVNEAPTINGQSVYNLSENIIAIDQLQIDDEDGDSLTVDILGADNDRVSIDGAGNLTFDAGPDFEFPADNGANNQYEFTVTAQDASETASLNIVVNISNVLEQVVLRNVTDIVFGENDVTDSSSQALFANIQIDDIGDDFANQQLIISGLLTGDNIQVVDNSGAQLNVDSSVNIQFEGQNVAQIDPSNNGLNGSDLIINLLTGADYDALIAILQNLNYSSDVANPVASRYININLENSGSETIAVFANTSFSLLTAVGTPLLSEDVGDNAKPVLVDIDGDDDLDAFIAEDSQIAFYQNQGTDAQANFTLITPTSSPLNGLTLSSQPSLVFVDIDKDTDVDLFIAGSTGAVSYYENTGDSQNPTFIQRTGSDNPLNSVAAGEAATISFADIDFDLDLDVFIATASGGIEYWSNTGSSSSPSYSELTGLNNPLNSINIGNNPDLTFIDIELDGDLDIFIGHSAGTVAFIENTGNQTTAAYQQASSGDNPLSQVLVNANASPFAADLDNDGDKDVLVGEQNGSIQYWQNNSSLQITVSAVNDAPDIDGDAVLSVEENISLVHTYQIEDEESDDFTVTLTGDDAALFNIDNSGNLTFITPPDFENPSDADTDNQYLVTINAEDINNNVNTLDIIIDVTGTEEITIQGQSSYQVAENTQFVANFIVTDGEGDALTLNKEGVDSAFFNIEQSGHLSFINAPDFENIVDDNNDNIYEFTLRATDSNGFFTTMDVSIEVTDVNETPVLNGSEQYSVFENTNRVAIFSGVDPDAADVGQLAYSLSGDDAALFTVTSAVNEQGILSFQPAQDFETPVDADADNIYQVTLTLTDLAGETDSLDISVALLNIEELTFLSGGDVDVTENTEIVSDLVVVDEEGDEFTLSISGDDAEHFYVTAERALAFLVLPNYEQPVDFDRNNIYQITLTATDTGNDSATLDMNITVLPENEAPNIETATPFSVVEDSEFTTTVAVTDDELDDFTFGLSGTDANFFTLLPNGTLSLNSALDFENPQDADLDNVYHLVITATDINGNANTHDIEIHITNFEELTQVSEITDITLIEEEIKQPLSTTLLPNIELTDPDLTLANHRLRLTGAESQDSFTIANNDNEQITVDELTGQVFYQNQLVATIDGNNNGQQGNNLILTFSDIASDEAGQAVLRSLVYSNNNEIPSGERQVQITLTDTTGRTLSLSNFKQYRAATNDEFNLSEFALPENTNLSFADFNGDQLTDLIIGDGQGRVHLILNTANAVSPDDLSIETGIDLNVIDVGDNAYPATGDFDNDGDLDLLIANGSGFVSYFENRTTIETISFVLLSGSNNPLFGIDVGTNAKVQATDLDGDFDLDVVLVNDLNELTYLENTGTVSSPIFSQTSNSPFDMEVLNPPLEFAFNDNDNDGDSDLLFINANSTFEYYQNIGTRTQANFEIVEELQSPFSSIAAEIPTSQIQPHFVDIDDDNDDDLILKTGSGQLFAYINQQGLNFRISSPNNLAPIVTLEQEIDVVSGNNVLVSPTVSDPENDGLTQSWRQLTGTELTASSEIDLAANDLSFVAPTVSEIQQLTFDLVASDGRNTTTSTLTINVYPLGSNIPGRFLPVVSTANQLTVPENALVQLSATATDADGETLTINWAQTEGELITINSATSLTPSFIAPNVDQNSSLTLLLTVSDGTFEVTETVTITVTNTPEADPEPETQNNDDSSGGSTNLNLWIALFILIFIRQWSRLKRYR